MPFYRWLNDDLLLTLRVQPRGGRSALGEPHGEALKVRLQAAPVDGAANAELVRLLAETFGVGRAAVNLVSGERGRTKQVRITSPTRLPAMIPWAGDSSRQ